MMKYIIIVLGILTITSCQQATNHNNIDSSSIALVEKDERKPLNAIEESIYQSGDSMMNAFINRDWNSFARFINPTMVRIMGGTDNLAQLTKQQMQEVPDSVIKSAKLIKVIQVEKEGNELQSLVKQQIVMEMDGNRIISTNYLIGESINQGKSWTFFDASVNGKIKPLDVKPNLSPKLKILNNKKETVNLY